MTPEPTTRHWFACEQPERVFPSAAGTGTVPLDGTRDAIPLTGDCEVDCQQQCAYPGQFSECEMDTPEVTP